MYILVENQGEGDHIN